MEVSKLNKLQQKEITEVLSRFGLSQKDQQIYLALLQSGKITITPLSRLVNQPVTTVQSAIGRLVDKGIVDVTKQKSRHVYEAHDPSILKKIIERQAQDVASIIPFLNTLKTETTISPKIRVYYRDRVTDIFHEALKCEGKLVYEIVSAKDFQEIIGERFHFTRRRLKNDVYLKSLRVQETEIKKYSKKTHERELREAKFLPSELTFRCSIMFWDNTVAFFTTKEEGLAWTVESKTLVETMKQMFGLMWSVGRKMETAIE